MTENTSSDIKTAEQIGIGDVVSYHCLPPKERNIRVGTVVRFIRHYKTYTGEQIVFVKVDGCRWLKKIAISRLKKIA